MNIHESDIALICVDSHFKRNLNHSHVQRIGNVHETCFCGTNTCAVVYLNI